MSSTPIYHYVYLIEDLSPPNTERFYIGVRSSKVVPELDKYMGSPKDKDFKRRIVENPHDFIKTIVDILPSREIAVQLEINLHNTYDVAKNNLFYNRSKQTSTGYSVQGVSNHRTKGKAAAKLSSTQEHIGFVDVNDIRWSTKEIVGTGTGIPRKQIQNTKMAKNPVTGISLGRISSEDHRWITGEIIHHNIGIKRESSAPAKCVTSNKILGNISMNDPRWITGEIVGIRSGSEASEFQKNSANAKDVITEISLGHVSYDDIRWGSGEIVPYNLSTTKPECRNTQPAKDINLNSLGRVDVDDSRWSDNIIIAACTKNFYIIQRDNDKKIIKKKDIVKFEDWLIIQ